MQLVCISWIIFKLHVAVDTSIQVRWARTYWTTEHWTYIFFHLLRPWFIQNFVVLVSSPGQDDLICHIHVMRTTRVGQLRPHGVLAPPKKGHNQIEGGMEEFKATIQFNWTLDGHQTMSHPQIITEAWHSPLVQPMPPSDQLGILPSQWRIVWDW